MDGEKSFYPHSKGIEYLLNESKVAFMETGDVIRSVNKVETIWIALGHDGNIKCQKCAGMGLNGFIFKRINEN